MRFFVLAVLAFGTVAQAAPEVSVSPERVVLGRDALVEVEVRAGAGSKLRWAANLGQLTEGEPSDPALRKFRYQPPSIKYPQTAVLLFWLEGPLAPDPAVVRIPMLGRTDLEASTEPGAVVRVEVAKALFGPVSADRRGRVVVPIEVPPGESTANVLAESRGLATSRQVPLEVPKGNPLAAFLTPDPVEAGKGGWMEVVHEGLLDPSALQVQVQGGTAAREESAPTRALYRISPDETATRIQVQISIPADPSAQAQVEAAIYRKPPPPPPPPVLPPPPKMPGLEVGASAGYFRARTRDAGPAIRAGAAYPLPFDYGHLALELSAGLRRAGRADASTWAVPLEASFRLRAVEVGKVSLSGRVGGGVIPFRYLGPAGAESGLTSEVFGAAQLAYRMAPYEVFTELKAALAPVRTSHEELSVGGTFLSVGVRYELP